MKMLKEVMETDKAKSSSYNKQAVVKSFDTISNAMVDLEDELWDITDSDLRKKCLQVMKEAGAKMTALQKLVAKYKH